MFPWKTVQASFISDGLIVTKKPLSTVVVHDDQTRGHHPPRGPSTLLASLGIHPQCTCGATLHAHVYIAVAEDGLEQGSEGPFQEREEEEVGAWLFRIIIWVVCSTSGPLLPDQWVLHLSLNLNMLVNLMPLTLPMGVTYRMRDS
ncbi:unnamed protein product [Sphenostylis stenocarpa]|uniref:Uncharacterized protein n=1 Tax=Sphenostylis stenocarpa TaxID=92480 RepID=A0AA86S6N5_9FABA|nr:unnamed protein product [Sphenostylis stenocarpa]